MTPFRFKQFSVAHDRCAMKVGTDGVLLGAWTSLETNPESILDIGAGSGIIGLQMAQRSSAQTIDAVEIDDHAYEQCVENFEDSPWGDRLFCYHASFREFFEEMGNYDLIVSNPPFHDPSSQKTTRGNHPFSEDRKMARHRSSLPFQELLLGVSKLLTEKGIFTVVVPKESEDLFVNLAHIENLHLQKRTEVRGNPGAPIKRSLLQFGFQQSPLKTDLLIIEKSRHIYTDTYIELVKDFYLDM